MKTNYTVYLRAHVLIFIVCCVVSCTTNDPVVAEADYPTKIIGSWQGLIGDERETMTLKRDSTFVCEVRPRGFIANTLSQVLPGTIRGKWSIMGAVITLNVTREKNVTSENSVASSTIASFKQDSLVLKSDSGGVSTFRRMLNL